MKILKHFIVDKLGKKILAISYQVMMYCKVYYIFSHNYQRVSFGVPNTLNFTHAAVANTTNEITINASMIIFLLVAANLQIIYQCAYTNLIFFQTLTFHRIFTL